MFALQKEIEVNMGIFDQYCKSGRNLPKTHQSCHYFSSIIFFEDPKSSSTEAGEHGHKDLTKNPWRNSNKRDPERQMINTQTRRQSKMMLTSVSQPSNSKRERRFLIHCSFSPSSFFWKEGWKNQNKKERERENQTNCKNKMITKVKIKLRGRAILQEKLPVWQGKSRSWSIWFRYLKALNISRTSMIWGFFHPLPSFWSTLLTLLLSWDYLLQFALDRWKWVWENRDIREILRQGEKRLLFLWTRGRKESCTRLSPLLIEFRRAQRNQNLRETICANRKGFWPRAWQISTRGMDLGGPRKHHEPSFHGSRPSLWKCGLAQSILSKFQIKSHQIFL